MLPQLLRIFVSLVWARLAEWCGESSEHPCPVIYARGGHLRIDRPFIDACRSFFSGWVIGNLYDGRSAACGCHGDCSTGRPNGAFRTRTALGIDRNHRDPDRSWRPARLSTGHDTHPGDGGDAGACGSRLVRHSRTTSQFAQCCSQGLAPFFQAARHNCLSRIVLLHDGGARGTVFIFYAVSGDLRLLEIRGRAALEPRLPCRNRGICEFAQAVAALQLSYRYTDQFCGCDSALHSHRLGSVVAHCPGDGAAIARVHFRHLSRRLGRTGTASFSGGLRSPWPSALLRCDVRSRRRLWNAFGGLDVADRGAAGSIYIERVVLRNRRRHRNNVVARVHAVSSSAVETSSQVERHVGAGCGKILKRRAQRSLSSGTLHIRTTATHSGQSSQCQVLDRVRG